MPRTLPNPAWMLIFLLTTPSPAVAGQAVSPALRQADSAYRAGQAALAQHDLAAAQKDFAEVVRLVPGMEQGHSALGAVLLSNGHPREAIHELEAALALKKIDTLAQTNLAMAYVSAGEPARSIPLFQALNAEANAANRQLAPAVLAAYARAEATTGNTRAALGPMKEATDADPRNPEWHDELGSLYAQQRSWPAAEAEFAQAVALGPALALAHLHLALALEAQGKDGAAELARAAQLAPENPAIALQLGKAYAAAGQEKQALAAFQQVLDREPNSTAAMLGMALTLQRLDRSAEALTLLAKVVAAEPKNATALADYGMALTQAQQAKEAVPVFERSIALAPGDAVAHEDLAASFIQLNQLEDGIRELHSALKLAPDSPQIHYDLGFAFKMQDQPAAAIPEFEAAQKLDPASPEAPYALGVLYLQAGRYAEAAQELKASLALRPENGDGWATLGSVYNNLNQLPEATAALRKATEQMPEQPEPHLTLAAVLVKQNQLAEATEQRKLAATLMRANMNQQRAEVATNAGNGLLKSGDLAGAAERFRSALGYDPRYREAHLGLARVLDAQGKTLEAAAERKQAEAPAPATAP